MAFKSVIKQNKVVDDNNVNQLFVADNTKDYYDGQAVTLDADTWLLAPAVDADEVIFWLCCCDRPNDTLENDYKINVRQPRTWDTFLIKTDFDLEQANIGTYYGIVPEEDDDSNLTGWYLISTDWTQKQWRLISILWDRYGEFEFQRFTNVDAEVEANKVTSWEGAPSTTPAKVGLFYVDIDNDKAYVSTWTSSSSDWTALN